MSDKRELPQAYHDTRSEGEKRITSLEHELGWNCLWQEKTFNGRKIVEYFWWHEAKTPLSVVKDYEGQIRTGKQWPKMIACEVFAPVDTSNTWGGLEDKLRAESGGLRILATITATTASGSAV